MLTDIYHCRVCLVEMTVVKGSRPGVHHCNIVGAYVSLDRGPRPKVWHEGNMFEPEKNGFWFVYGQDTQAYPLLATDDELTAYKFALDHHGSVVFWEFGIAWDDLEK